MSKIRRELFVAVIFTSLLALALIPTTQAQNLAGRVVIDTDYELYGLGTLEGGGHLTWTLYSEQASHLREKIVYLFDEYMQLPPGFHCEGSSLSGTGGIRINFNDGIIDTDEAKYFTDFLEHYIEDSCPGDAYQGMPDRYITIDKSDILERDLPVDRSTENLVGSNANTDTLLRIKFIFNGNTQYNSFRFNLGESSLPNALHKVFEFDQTSFFIGTAMPPLQPMGGWHVAWIGNEYVFTPSYTINPSVLNTTEGYWGFSRGTSNTTEFYPTFTIGSNRGMKFSQDYYDLRLSDTADVFIDYMGYRNANGTRLKLQIATNSPAFDNWIDVFDEFGNDYFLNTPWLSWNTIRFPLNQYIGELVRLRLNFTSTPSAFQAPGFFIRNLQIKGESNYHGTVEYNSVNYVVSTTSFSHFAISQGSANMIRTPAGDILFYSITYDSESGIPPDSILYSSFDFFENAQITFGLTLASVYMIAYYQNRYFTQFKAAHPLRYRPAAGRIKWLHWLGRILIILTIIFYFFPGIFAFAAPGFMIGGPAMWFLCFFFVIGIALLSKFMYMRHTKYIPPERIEEEIGISEALGVPLATEKLPTIFCADCLNVIESPENIYECECGKSYHKLCASELGECPECHRKIIVELPEEKIVILQCPTCKEVQHVKEDADLSRTRCTNCDTVLRALDEGLNYLIIDKDASSSYSWFLGLVRRKKPSLCMTTAFPEKVKKEYELEEVDLYWLSDTNPGPKTVDPKRLDFEVIRAIGNFVKKFKGGAVLLDGLEYLVVENGFDKTFKFVKRVNDLCSVHGATFLVPISPGALNPDDLMMLKQEFDRVEEMVTPPPPPPAKKR